MRVLPGASSPSSRILPRLHAILPTRLICFLVAGMIGIAAESSQGQEAPQPKGQQAASNSLAPAGKPPALVKDPRSPSGQTTLGQLAGRERSLQSALPFHQGAFLPDRRVPERTTSSEVA